MIIIVYRFWLLIKVSNFYIVELLEFVMVLYLWILWVCFFNEFIFLMNYNILYYFIKDVSKFIKNGFYEIL